MTQDILLGIREILQTYNCSLRTLRFYEDLGLLRPVVIDGQRLYGAKDEIRLKLILCGRRLGFSLREIKDLIEEREAARSPNLEHLTPVGHRPAVRRLHDELARLSEHPSQIVAALVEVKEAQLSSATGRNVFAIERPVRQ